MSNTCYGIIYGSHSPLRACCNADSHSSPLKLHPTLGMHLFSHRHASLAPPTFTTPTTPTSIPQPRPHPPSTPWCGVHYTNMRDTNPRTQNRLNGSSRGGWGRLGSGGGRVAASCGALCGVCGGGGGVCGSVCGVCLWAPELHRLLDHSGGGEAGQGGVRHRLH